jgi:tetratricopeptide (TPR) repeat protein
MPRLDGGPGPALPLASAQIDGALDAALDAAFPSRAQAPSSGARAEEPRPSRAKRRAKVTAAVVLLAATLGSAAFAAIGHWRARPPVAPAVPASPPAAATHATPASALAPTRAPPSESDATPAPSLAPASAPPVAIEPPAAATRPRLGASSQDLLREANALRSARRWSEADQAYERVFATRPGGEDAYVALVAAGALRVDHLGDPRGALRLLGAADRLRPRGPLDEAIGWSRVAAFRALGDATREAQALDTFVATYPDSPWQPAARRRLQELRP